MNKIWKYSIAGVLCAGGLYTGILNHVEQQVTNVNKEKMAFLKKNQERNELIKTLNDSNQKLNQLELTYDQITKETNQRNLQIVSIKSDISQIQNKIKAMANSNQIHQSSASTPIHSTRTNSTVSRTANSTRIASNTKSTVSKTPIQYHPSIVVSPTPPVVQTTTKASGS